MNRSNPGDGNREGEATGGPSWWEIAAGVVGGAAAVGGLIYALSSSRPGPQTASTQSPSAPPAQTPSTPHTSSDEDDRQSPPSVRSSSVTTAARYLYSLMDYIPESATTIPYSSIPENPVITNLNSLLDDIYVRYVALKNEDFNLYFGVFSQLFDKLQTEMKLVDKYYNKYSSRKQFAGSHFDGLRIKRPDEFDMDIVIGLPLNFRADPSGHDDIALQPLAPGYVQLKLGQQFRRLPQRDAADWLVNRTAYEWKDDKDFLLRNKFIDWFKSVVHRALNRFEDEGRGRKIIRIDGVPYTIRTTESGPAITFIVENASRDFKLDVDFVPALKFPEARWPICRGYRAVPPGCAGQDFMLVPKPNKAAACVWDETRCWRIAMHDQEKKLMYNLSNLKPTLRLLKKLRDAQGMDKIASYYIKTIFFWEILARPFDSAFWKQGRGTLFKIMVERLYECVNKGEILYLWNTDLNLLGQVNRATLNGYAAKLQCLMRVLQDPSQYKLVARYLLTPEEQRAYARFLI
ncbi:hypothetical protein JYU34_016673 [Plutella xylostella]|uniref:Cyclic GMP-AMP synthase n=1 Tax=Plutella xylostella TaxID=51655 RepID=A0ABQ7Q368_PLUXY|nr:hypothetical protein JYU34_016673 [Plutella xylostella]